MRIVENRLLFLCGRNTLFQFLSVVGDYLIAIGRLRQMFSCHALRFLDCPYLFTCVLCVKIIKQVAERGKIVVAFGTVYAVINEKYRICKAVIRSVFC